MAEIFLSYRRQDSQSATGRLAERLEAYFGDERVFRDHEIAPGDNFVDAIRRAVESSTVVLAVVGRRWLDARDAEGRRRLDDHADFVRLEIELALAANVPLVPVLVEGATMPAAHELPPSLAGFARCQAVELSETRWRYDADRLIETLQSRFAIDSDRAPLADAAQGTGVLTRWGVDLVDLARQPQRLIARRNTGRAGDQVRAFAFLCAAIVAGNAMLLTVIDLELVARGTFAEVAVGVASWFVTGLLLGLLVAGFLTVTLALAWRVAARRAGYRRVGLIGAYVYGGTWLGLCAGAVLAVTAVHLTDPSWLARGVAALHTSMAASAPVSVPPVALDTAPMRGAATVLIVLGGLIFLATAVWCVVAWGAFRRAFAATRLQAWLATSLWIALLVAIVWLPLQLVAPASSIAAKNEGGPRAASISRLASVAIALPRRLSCGRIANETSNSVVVPTDEGRIHAIRHDDKSRTFVAREIAAGLKRSYDSAVIDIDRDGLNDIVTLTLEHNGVEAVMAVLDSERRSRFEPRSLRRGLRYPYGLAVGDVNGDKHADIAVVEYEAGAVRVLVNDGHGHFSEVVVSSSVSGGQTVVIADLDNDGRADLVSTARSGAKVIVHFQDRRLSFVDQVVASEVAEPAFATAVDLDSDGDLDIVFASRVSPDLYLVENLGARRFAKPVALVRNVPGTYSIVASDLDGDGDLDLLTASITDSVVRAHYNDGARGYSTQVVDSGLQNAQSIVKCDLDGDGRTEFAVSGAQANEVRIYSLR